MTLRPKARAGATHRRRAGERGQSTLLVAIMLIVFLGITGLVIDVARLYVAQRQLQTAADAAALAAAQDLPNGTTAVTTACTYSASDAPAGSCDGVTVGADGLNKGIALNGVQTTTQLECVGSSSAGVGCVVGAGCPANAQFPPSGQGGCNAIKVSEKATKSLLFMRVLGIDTWDVAASSTAAMAGGTPHPLDVEVLTDSTASMQQKCSSSVAGVPNTSTTPTKLDCANAGVRALLQTMYPCSLSGCGAGSSRTTSRTRSTRSA